MPLSDLTTICVLMALSLIALICIFLICAPAAVSMLYPDRIISKEIWEMSKTALSIVGSLGPSLVVAVVAQKIAAVVTNQPKQ